MYKYERMDRVDEKEGVRGLSGMRTIDETKIKLGGVGIGRLIPPVLAKINLLL